MSVIVRPRGPHWQYDIRFRWPDGEKFFERKNAPVASKSGALRWAQDRERELIKAGKDAYVIANTPPPKVVPTLEEFWPRFMRDHYHANQMKPSTIETATTLWETHLQPALGSKRLDEIDASVIAELKGTLATKPTFEKSAKTSKKLAGRDAQFLKPKSINNILIVLSAALTEAVEWGLIPERPKIKMLQTADSAFHWYEVHDYRRLVDGAARVGRDRLILVLLGGSHGLRRGEIIALKWSDLDIGRRQIRVSRSVWWAPAEDGRAAKAHETLPKGGRSRIVPMSPELVEALRAHKHLASERVLCDGEGRDLTYGLVESWIETAQRRAGLPVTGAVHMLRHTFCSHLAAAGASAKAIQEIAGHVDLKTTLKYMHLAPSDKASAMAVLAGYYKTEGVAQRAAASEG